MGEVRDADLGQAELLARITAAGFYDDPVMMWVFPDAATRLDQLELAFAGFVRDFLPDRGTVHVLDDACVTFWRPPEFDYDAPTPADVDAEADGDTGQHPSVPFTPDVLKRFGILDGAMREVHPHGPHWYRNVISTVPERQGHGLGARTLEPVLTICDTDAIPAYLESSNPRNMTLYRRHGFEQTGEITLPDGPSLYPMWREPRG